MASEFKGGGGMGEMRSESAEQLTSRERETKVWVESAYNAYVAGLPRAFFAEYQYEPLPEEEARATSYIVDFSDDAVNALHYKDSLVLTDVLGPDRFSFSHYDFVGDLIRYGLEHKPSDIIHKAGDFNLYDTAWHKMVGEHREFYAKELVAELRAIFLSYCHRGFPKEEIIQKFEQDFLANTYLELAQAYDDKDPQMRRIKEELLPETEKRIAEIQQSLLVDTDGGKELIRKLDAEDDRRWEDAVEQMGLEKGQEHADEKKEEVDNALIGLAESLSRAKNKNSTDLHDILEQEKGPVVGILHRVLNPEAAPFFEEV